MNKTKIEIEILETNWADVYKLKDEIENVLDKMNIEYVVVEIKEE